MTDRLIERMRATGALQGPYKRTTLRHLARRARRLLRVAWLHMTLARPYLDWPDRHAP